MAMLTDKKCPECGLDMEERADRRSVLSAKDGKVVTAMAREFRCFNGHIWLLVAR